MDNDCKVTQPTKHAYVAKALNPKKTTIIHFLGRISKDALIFAWPKHRWYKVASRKTWQQQQDPVQAKPGW